MSAGTSCLTNATDCEELPGFVTSVTCPLAVGTARAAMVTEESVVVD
jgi:hypothetical protein